MAEKTQNVKIITTKKNIVAQKMRAALNMTLACSKDGDEVGLRVALKQLELAHEELKSVLA